MLEHLNKIGKDCGCSLDQMKDLWLQAKKQASKKGLPEGGQAHTQTSIQLLKILAMKKRESFLASKDQPKEAKKQFKKEQV